MPHPPTPSQQRRRKQRNQEQRTEQQIGHGSKVLPAQAASRISREKSARRKRIVTTFLPALSDWWYVVGSSDQVLGSALHVIAPRRAGRRLGGEPPRCCG